MTLLDAAEVAKAFVSSREFVGWGTLSLINSGIAQGLNRDGFGWWIVSLALGPVATFFLVVSAKLPCKCCKGHKE